MHSRCSTGTGISASTSTGPSPSLAPAPALAPVQLVVPNEELVCLLSTEDTEIPTQLRSHRRFANNSKPLGSLFHPTDRELIEYLIEKRAGTLNHDKLISEVDNIYHYKASDLGGMSHFHRDGKLYIFTKSSHLAAFRPASAGCWVRNGIPVLIQENKQVVRCTTFEWMKEGDKKLKMKEIKTRTRSSIQIPRNIDTYESTSLKGLYPVGEGAGYAGGIVSAAVDAMHAGFAVARNFDLYIARATSQIGPCNFAVDQKIINTCNFGSEI